MGVRHISDSLKGKVRTVAGRNGSRRRPSAELVIITGISGSGKDTVLNTFEDLGYYCVDNLPVDLMPRFAELVRRSRDIERTAIVVDVRERERLDRLPNVLTSVRRLVPTTVLFLEARGAVLHRRFS